MANGDCPIGATNAADIRHLESQMAETRDDVKQLCRSLEELHIKRARLDGWSALAIAIIAGVCSIAGPAIAAAVKAHLGQ